MSVRSDGEGVRTLNLVKGLAWSFAGFCAALLMRVVGHFVLFNYDDSWSAQDGPYLSPQTMTIVERVAWHCGAWVSPVLGVASVLLAITTFRRWRRDAP